MCVQRSSWVNATPPRLPTLFGDDVTEEEEADGEDRSSLLAAAAVEEVEVVVEVEGEEGRWLGTPAT